jgi:hypothetical protein
MMRQSWIINGALFQLAWFSAALLTQYAALLIGILLLLHFYLLDKNFMDAKLLVLAPIGWVLDSLLIHFEVFSTSSGWIPLWLILLWCMFILSLNHSLLWLSKLDTYWQVLIGAVAGSMSYTAAVKFGALQSDLPWLHQICYLAISWAILLPTLVKLQSKLLPVKHSQNEKI